MAGAVALWLILTWYGATSEVPWLFLLAAWALALVVIAAVYQAWNRTGLHLHLAVRQGVAGDDSPLEELPEQLLRAAPQAPLFEGDGAVIELGLDTSRRAQGPAWIRGEIATRELRLGVGLVPRSGWRSSLSVEPLRRGALGATGWSIGTSDPLGFFAGTRECPDSDVALVFPRFKSLVNHRPVRELEAVSAAPRAGAGNELFGIREYRAGDSLRRIHWRSSARHGELVVREYEPPGVQTIRLVVDPAPPTREIADQVARLAASEAWDCVREGGRVALGDLESRDIWEILEWLARYPDADCSGAGRDAAIVVISADPGLIEPIALRNWLVGDAPVDADVQFTRVGTAWPL